MAEKRYAKQVQEKCYERLLEYKTILPDYINKYINYMKDKSDSTKLAYIRDIEHFLNYILTSYEECQADCIKNISIDTLSSLDLDFFNDYLEYAKLYRVGDKTRSNSEVTLNRKTSAIKSLFSYLYITNKIPSNPTEKIKSTKTDKKLVECLNDKEVNELMDAVEFGGKKFSSRQLAYHEKSQKRDYALLSLLLGTGIRVSEAVGLNIDDLNIKEYEMKVIRKGGKEDKVYMSDDLIEVIKDYLEYRKTLNTLEGHENALFLSYQGKRLSVRSIEKLVKKYFGSVDTLKKTNVHILRKTYGTHFLERTNNLELTSRNLGHSSVSTTHDFYMATSEEYRKLRRND